VHLLCADGALRLHWRLLLLLLLLLRPECCPLLCCLVVPDALEQPAGELAAWVVLLQQCSVLPFARMPCIQWQLLQVQWQAAGGMPWSLTSATHAHSQAAACIQDIAWILLLWLECVCAHLAHQGSSLAIQQRLQLVDHEVGLSQAGLRLRLSSRQLLCTSLLLLAPLLELCEGRLHAVHL
jgi:hypothetical protein